MTISAERYAHLLDAIAAAASVSALADLRREIRRAYPRDERAAALEQMIDARARELLDTIHDADAGDAID